MSLSTLLNAAFESGKSGLKVYSMLTKNSINNVSNTLTPTDSNSDPQLYEFLKKYSFTDYILNTISDTVSDVFSKSSLHISLSESDDELEKEVNNFLDDASAFEAIKSDLKDILFYGNYGYRLDFADNRIKRLVQATTVITEDTFCTNPRLLIDEWNDEEKSNYALLPIQYRPKRYTDVTELDAYLEQFDNQYDLQKEKEKYLKAHPNADKIVKHSLYKGVGALDPVMLLLLLLYMKELLYDLLGLKDTMRPDVLTARIMDDKTDEAKIAEAINDIEALVNQGSATQTEPGFGSFLSISNLLSGIQSYLQNGIKVVPEMQNFTSISNLNLPSLVDKRRQLKDEIEELRNRILNQLGIDDSTSQNKWDAMQRNSKYLTLIEYVVDCISTFIRNAALEFLRHKHKNLNLSLRDIRLDLDTTNIIFNQYSITRSRVMLDKVDAVSRIIRSISDWRDSDSINQTQLEKYLNKMITDIDPTAGELFSTDGTSDNSSEV